MESSISAQQPALTVENVVKRFNVAAEPWWRRFVGARSSAAHNGAAGQTNGAAPAREPLKARRGKELITAVDHVSFTVQRREICGVLGPNGSGKSTLIRLLSTLLLPDEGTVTVFGLDIDADEMRVKRLINRVSVEAAFFKKLSPKENLLYGARLYGVSGREADEKAREILKRLGLRESSYTSPMEDMSRGMQQKVAIARAFLTQPILLLLDEPTTGLDPRSKLEVESFINELRDVHDATILITTHDMNEADALCDRIATLDDGKSCRVVVPDDQLSLAIGKEGQNARLAAKLTGYKIDIKPASNPGSAPEEESGETEE